MSTSATTALDAALNAALASVRAATGTASRTDFAAYRRELPRLLAEGHANRWALIRDGALISVLGHLSRLRGKPAMNASP